MAQVLTTWRDQLAGISCTPRQFYDTVVDALAYYKLPYRISFINYKSGFGKKRLHLRVHNGMYHIDIGAQPQGKWLFISMQLVEKDYEEGFLDGYEKGLRWLGKQDKGWFFDMANMSAWGTSLLKKNRQNSKAKFAHQNNVHVFFSTVQSSVREVMHFLSEERGYRG